MSVPAVKPSALKWAFMSRWDWGWCGTGVGDMAAELCGPRAAEEIRPISAAGKHPASARPEKSVAVSPAIAKEGISVIFSFSGCCAMTSALQLKIQLQRTFSNI